MSTRKEKKKRRTLGWRMECIAIEQQGCRTTFITAGGHETMHAVNQKQTGA